MTLPAANPLTAVISSFFAAHSRRFGRLGVDHPSAGLRVSPQSYPQALAQRGVQTLPRPVDAPSPEPVVDGLPGREVSGQQPPRAATLEHVEEGVEDCP